MGASYSNMTGTMSAQDYSIQFRNTLEQAWIKLHSVQTKTSTDARKAVSTLGYATQQYAVAGSSLELATKLKEYTLGVYSLARQGTAMVGIANDLAARSATLGGEATSAMAAAATSIKAAGEAFDLYLASVAAVYAIASFEDSPSDVSRSATLAHDDADAARRFMSSVRQDSMRSNVLAAQSEAQAAEQSMEDTTQKIGDVAERASQSYEAASARETELVLADVAAQAAATGAVRSFSESEVDAVGLQRTARVYGRVANFGLTAEYGASAVGNDASLASASDAGSRAITSRARREGVKQMYFFAVPAGEQYSFSQSKALKLIGANGAAFSQGTLQNGEWSAALSADTNGKRLGAADQYSEPQQYVVFALAQFAGNERSDNSPTYQLSLPSAPITPSHELPASLKLTSEDGGASTSQTFVRVSCDAGQCQSFEEYRFYMVRADVARALGSARLAEVLAGRGPAFYKLAQASQVASNDAKGDQAPLSKTSAHVAIKWSEGEADAYGDLIVPGGHYWVVSLPVSNAEGLIPVQQAAPEATAQGAEPSGQTFLPVAAPSAANLAFVAVVADSAGAAGSSPRAKDKA